MAKYEPTPAGEPRPKPPKPDTPNSGRTHSFQSHQAAPVAPEASSRRGWLRDAAFCVIAFYATVELMRFFV